jgi:phosphoglycerate dehydrogenase-like enzyme
MTKCQIAVLDDYQNAALESADWSVLRDRADITVFEDHLADPDAVIERLLPFDVVCVMHERTPLPRKIIERLPNLKLIASTGSANASIDVTGPIMGLQWFTRGIGRIRPSNLPGR